MKTFVLFLCLVLAVSGKITQFTWNDCGTSDANRAIKFNELTVSPIPLLAPGDLTIHVKVEVTKTIPKLSLKLDVNRHTFLTTVHIPCTQGLGSCTVDGCTILNTAAGADATQKSLNTQIIKMFTDNNFNFHCPVPSQSLSVQTFTMKFPELSRAADIFADGDYTIEARALNPDTGELYGCLHFDAALKRACTGWLCTRRR